MIYMGSKTRIARDILPIMLQDRNGRPWVEPFVGGGNMIDKVDGHRIGSDLSRYAIEALVAIRDYYWALPADASHFTEAEYNALRTSDICFFKGFAGFAYSYAGKWLNSWRRDKEGRRDYVAEAYRNAEKQSPALQGVELYNLAYFELEIPPRSLIYCDPPYAETGGYRSAGAFDSAKFWQWCRDKAEEGHVVYISEYSAPPDFECVWSKEINGLKTATSSGKKATEKLYKAPPGLMG